MHNVLFISVDSLRFDKVAVMPTVKKLAEEGLFFTQHFTVANGSMPSHCSIFTGKYPQHHGVRENGVKLPDVRTLAQILREQGFKTTGFVSSILLDSYYGINAGFDEYSNASKHPWVEHYLTKIGYGKYNVQRVLWYLGLHDGRTRSCHQVNKDVLAWLDKNNEKFFMFVHYFDIHRDTYGNKKRIVEKHSNYDHNARLIDSAIAQVIEKLREKGQLEKTMVVIFSDHGESLDSNDKGHGKNVKDEEFHTPFIIYNSRNVKSQIKALSRTIDMAPTVLSLLKINSEGNEHVHGMDGTNILAHEAEEVFMEAYPPYGDVKAVRTLQWKFVLTDGVHQQLFDMQNDPHETTNVLEENISVAQQLRTKLKRHFKVEFTQQELDEVTKERLKGLGYLD